MNLHPGLRVTHLKAAGLEADGKLIKVEGERVQVQWTNGVVKWYQKKWIVAK